MVNATLLLKSVALCSKCPLLLYNYILGGKQPNCSGRKRGTELPLGSHNKLLMFTIACLLRIQNKPELVHYASPVAILVIGTGLISFIVKL